MVANDLFRFASFQFRQKKKIPFQMVANDLFRLMI